MKCEDCPEKDNCDPARTGIEPCQPYIGSPTEEEFDYD